jgi:hypothetical protein
MSHPYAALSLRDTHPTAFHTNSQFYPQSVSHSVTCKEIEVIGDKGLFGGLIFNLVKIDGVETVEQFYKVSNGSYYEAFQNTLALLNNTGLDAPIGDEFYYLDYPWEGELVKKMTSKLVHLGMMSRGGTKFIPSVRAEKIAGVVAYQPMHMDPVIPFEVEEPVKVPKIKKNDLGVYQNPETAALYVQESYEQRKKDLYSILIQFPPKSKFLFYGDGAGVGDAVAKQLMYDSVSYDSSQIMVDEAKKKGNNVKLGDEKVLKIKLVKDRIVFISHVMSLAPTLQKFLKPLRKVAIFETKIFPSFSLYDNKIPCLYTKGIDFGKPLTPVVKDYTAKVVSAFDREFTKPGVIVGVSTKHFYWFLRTLYNGGHRIKISNLTTVSNPLLLHEVISHFGHQLNPSPPNVWASDGPVFGKIPYYDIRSGVSSKDTVLISDEEYPIFKRIIHPREIRQKISGHVAIKMSRSRIKGVMGSYYDGSGTLRRGNYELSGDVKRKLEVC